jgi:hypothetical protein
MAPQRHLADHHVRRRIVPVSGALLGHTAGTDGPNETLSVLADLDLDVDGRSARLAGNGQHLVLTSEDPAHLWDTLTRASLPSGIGQVSGPRAVGRAASLLSDNGLTLDIVGPRGTVVRLGADAHSWAGRLLTGSEAVQPSSVRAVLPVGVRLGSRLAEGIGRRRRPSRGPGRRHPPAASLQVRRPLGAGRRGLDQDVDTRYRNTVAEPNGPIEPQLDVSAFDRG